MPVSRFGCGLNCMGIRNYVRQKEESFITAKRRTRKVRTNSFNPRQTNLCFLVANTVPVEGGKHCKIYSLLLKKFEPPLETNHFPNCYKHNTHLTITYLSHKTKKELSKM